MLKSNSHKKQEVHFMDITANNKHRFATKWMNTETVNYTAYLHAKGHENQVYPEKKHCSFCCSLLTPGLLKAFDFQTLDPSKNWYDVTISHESLKRGFQNYLFTTLPVWHRPHSSRPWKQLKYKNPLKYYWLKYTKGLDKI
jgi:hypothetical protein